MNKCLRTSPRWREENLVRKAGLEPACLSAPPPQDGVSANSTTSARSKLCCYSGLPGMLREGLVLAPDLHFCGRLEHTASLYYRSRVMAAMEGSQFELAAALKQ